MAKKSFLSCAITTSTYGSDDDNIHCFKTGQPCKTGRSLLDSETCNLQTVATDNELNEDLLLQILMKRS